MGGIDQHSRAFRTPPRLNYYTELRSAAGDCRLSIILYPVISLPFDLFHDVLITPPDHGLDRDLIHLRLAVRLERAHRRRTMDKPSGQQ